EGPLGGGRMLFAKERAHESGVEAVRPERGLGASAQQGSRGPTRIFGDESHVAAHIDVLRLVAAKNRPFHELAGHWIVDRPLQLGGLCRLTFSRGGDRAPQGRNVRRGGGVAGGERELWRRTSRSRGRGRTRRGRFRWRIPGPGSGQWLSDDGM